MQLVRPFGLSKRPFIHTDQPFIVFFVQSFIFFIMNVEKEHFLTKWSFFQVDQLSENLNNVTLDKELLKVKNQLAVVQSSDIKRMQPKRNRSSNTQCSKNEKVVQ